MSQHPMPVLTEQQREQMVADCELYLSNPSCYQDWFIVMTKVTLAALTAEPHAWHRMPDQGFHLPMVLRKEQGPPALEGEFYPVYDVPPVPVIKPIENDGWIDWGGGVMPVHEDTLLEVRFSDGGEDGPEPAYSWHWNHIGHSRDVFAYRVIENDGVGK